MPIDFSFIDPIFQADPARHQAALANFSGPPPPPANILGDDLATPPSTRFTSNDVTRILNQFRNGEIDLQSLFDALRGIGFTPEMAQHVVDGEAATRRQPIPTGPAAAAPPPPPPINILGDDLATPQAGGGTGAGATGGLGPGDIMGSLGGGTGGFVGSGTLGAGGDLAGNFGAGNIASLGSLSREEALRRQPFEDITSRVGAELFGPSSGLQRRVLDNLINRFALESPITQFGNQDFDPNTDRETAFRSFAATPRLSGLQLGEQLSNIFGSATTPTGMDQFEGAFGPQTEETEENRGTFSRLQRPLTLGTQPFLQRLSPFVRSATARAIEQRFRDMFAQDPTQFGQGKAADVFKELQRRKFLPVFGGQ